MALFCSNIYLVKVKCSNEIRPSCVSNKSRHFNIPLLSGFKPNMRALPVVTLQIDVPKIMKNTAAKLADIFVDSFLEFTDKPLLPSESNFAPVEELGEAILVTNIQGQVPGDFPEGVYIRNGANPLFGGLKSTSSIFGRSSNILVEGEGMLHALYLKKSTHGSWSVLYNNKHVEAETYKLEKQRNSFYHAVALLATKKKTILLRQKNYFNC